MWVDGAGREALPEYDGDMVSSPGVHVAPTRCSDGWIYIVAAMPAQFANLCQAMEVGADGSNSDDANQMGIRDELMEQINHKLSQMPVAQACALLEAHDVPVGPATWLKDVPSLTQLQATDYFATEQHPLLGEVLQARHPRQL